MGKPQSCLQVCHRLQLLLKACPELGNLPAMPCPNLLSSFCYLNCAMLPLHVQKMVLVLVLCAFFFFFFFFWERVSLWTKTQCVAQAGLRLTAILLPQSPKSPCPPYLKCYIWGQVVAPAINPSTQKAGGGLACSIPRVSGQQGRYIRETLSQTSKQRVMFVLFCNLTEIVRSILNIQYFVSSTVKVNYLATRTKWANV